MILADEFSENCQHIELQQAAEFGADNMAERVGVVGVVVIVVVGSFQCLDGLDSFDAEVPTFLQGLSIVSSSFRINNHTCSSSSSPHKCCSQCNGCCWY